MRLRSPAQLRVAEEDLLPVAAPNPELLAPLARAIHHAHCQVCGAPVCAVEDGDGVVQITCFGERQHAFFFAVVNGRIGDRPAAFGELAATSAAPDR